MPDERLLDGVPSIHQQLEWVRELVALGIRRPGYEADVVAEQWVRERFETFGLQDVRHEPVPLRTWRPGSCSVEVWPAGRRIDAIHLDAFALPYSAPTAGTTAAVTVLGSGDEAGAIVVEELTLTALPQAVVKALATDVNDPDRELDTLTQVLPFGARVVQVMEPAIDAGAVAFVGLLTGVPWETHDYYVPYDAVERPIPGVWVSGEAGRRILALLARGPIEARVVSEAAILDVPTHNVVGVLPGASDEWVIVASHHDGPWASAVEDATGVALVLAQAAYWSGVPASGRPHNLLFLVTSGHMAAAAGTAAFIEAHRELLDRVVLELHLEHVARECRPVDGRLEPTDDPEVRWWFTSRIADLERAVGDAVRAEDLGRSLVFPPDVFFENPPTDGAYFHAAGVPLVHFLTAPMYLFDSCDTLDKVHEASFEPLTRAAVRIISSLAGKDAAGMRAAVRPA